MEGYLASMAGLKLSLQQPQIADILGPITSTTLLSPEVQRTLRLSTINATSLLKDMHVPTINATSLLKDMHVPTINATSVLRGMQASMGDTASLLESIRIPPIDLGLELSGAVDITNLMQSVVTGDDVLGGWERGAFRANASLPFPGFDEAVRDFTTEAAERAEVDLASIFHEGWLVNGPASLPVSCS